VGSRHLAYYHGQIVARRLRGIDARADHTAVPRVTFTDPEVASVGLSEAAARARGIDVIVATADPAETARGYIHDFHRGVLKLVGDRTRGVLIGATLVTPRAGEILGELVLAIKLGTPLKTLADVIHPFPAFNRVLGESLGELGCASSGIRRAHVDLKLEVVVLPVSDVDRAKRFYESLGWRVDADFSGPDWRVVQVTPPAPRVPFSLGRASRPPLRAPYRARSSSSMTSKRHAAALVGRGAAVSEVFHYAAGRGPRVSGPDPQGRSYFSFASFSDPDGNSWLLQEIKTRLPGRGSARTCRRLRSFSERQNCTTASTNRPLRNIIGRSGTPGTSSRASKGKLPKKPRRMARSRWKAA
jgi:catechol 2,3-dioxygenase-like lactoylglutathione lyase family enzyme